MTLCNNKCSMGGKHVSILNLLYSLRLGNIKGICSK